MSRPTIALCAIMKNEEENIPRFLSSMAGCFDEIHITDTGSTDKSVEVAKAFGAKVHHFDWINDFAAARNYSFSHATTDYVFWADLDDVLVDAASFIEWRDHAMETADFWLATYHYYINPVTKEPLCSFARERAVKRSKGIQWQYFLHEGMMPQSGKGAVQVQYARTWNVTHLRGAEDISKDKSRNISIFESKIRDGVPLDSRMEYYFGKELFEAQRIEDCIVQLQKVIVKKDLEAHDRILALQYLAMALIHSAQPDPSKGNEEAQKEKNGKRLEYAKQICLQGLALAPERAEFFCFLSDVYLKLGQPREAIPYLRAAQSCVNTLTMSRGMASPIFAYQDCYGRYPTKQLIKVFVNLGKWDETEAELRRLETLYPGDPDAKMLREETAKVKALNTVNEYAERVDDIVITCPPIMLYKWDYDVYKSRGVGGSETAICEMAYHLKKLTGRRVLVFNNCEKAVKIEGIEFFPDGESRLYLNKFKPALHIAWRHNAKITSAPTYLWCHDLTAHNIEEPNYKKILCLSNFHKNFIKSTSPGITDDKFHITRNGIDPSRFKGKEKNKEYGKVIFSSSPDRGLDHAMRVMDEVVKEIPEAKLHVYYGFDNMEKYNMWEQVNYYKKMIVERPYVVYHGNRPQSELTKEFLSAEVWLYPTIFLETFCITAIEALCAGVYPVTRVYGALQDTLKEAHSKGMASLLPHAAETADQVSAYAREVINAIREKKWQTVEVDPDQYSWEGVAKEWVRDFLGG